MTMESYQSFRDSYNSVTNNGAHISNVSKIPLVLSWHNLTVSVPKTENGKGFWGSQVVSKSNVLNKVSGCIEGGTLMAIMGPSGCGKTTLLATISKRVQGNVTGEILLNGSSISVELMNKISGFVPQQDLCIETLTVVEHMQLMAKLKMDRRLRAAQRTRKITSLITELGLTKCSYTQLSALSGGERRRVALAVQLITDPAILFCDEPTTGLDSYSACVVVEKLRELATRGKAVVCSIHQPASGIFDLFHSVLFLVPGGKIAYNGPVDKAVQYFNELNMVCPPAYNVAEFLVSQLALKQHQSADGSKLDEICSYFKSSDIGRKLNKFLEAQLPGTGCSNWSSNNSESSMPQPEDEFIKYMHIQSPSQMMQLYWLLWRSLIDKIRRPQEEMLKLSLYVFIALLVSTPYSGLIINQEGIQNMQGFLYLVIVETVFTFSYRVCNTFSGELPILLREIGNGLYKPGPYYLSKILILLPESILEPLLFATIVFNIAGLFGGFLGFCKFALPIICSAIAASAYGCCISAVFEKIEFAALVSVPIEFITLTFCGLFISLNSAPWQFFWVRYVSMFYYGIEAVSILQWSAVDHIPCSEKEDIPCFSSGDSVLQLYGYSPNNLLLDLLGLSLIYCTAHMAGYFAFQRRSKKQATY
nr:PREDICTED: protein scarlet-like [Bemisia tabaci]